MDGIENCFDAKDIAAIRRSHITWPRVNKGLERRSQQSHPISKTDVQAKRKRADWNPGTDL